MLGAGVFVVWAPAAAAAGERLVWALAIAGAIAALNAMSTAALASRYPVAGGNYSYGTRELPGPWGFTAGIGFVAGKTASVAAMALAIGAYVWPGGAKAVACAAIVALWLINAAGVKRTAAVTGGIGVVVIGVVIAALAKSADAIGASQPQASAPGIGGVLHASALLFFAFAGYARLATLGEEVRRPALTIPLAIAAAFVIVATLYAAVAVVLVRTLGVEALAGSDAPLRDVVTSEAMRSVLAPTAMIAAGGALLALMAGMGRTAMAMARERDLPSRLARLNSRDVPATAEAVIALVAIALVLTVNLESVLGLSSCAVLLYYAVGHAAALRLRVRDKSFKVPAPLAGLGLLSCLVIALTLPLPVVASTLGVIALAVLVRGLAARSRAPRPTAG